MKKLLFLAMTFILIFILKLLNDYGFLPKKTYTAEYFHIQTVHSEIDYNHNGIDDYQDILIGAKKEAQRKPKYISKYYEGGYPPLNEGVCTDVIWRSLKEAGYDLKELITEDIKNNRNNYSHIQIGDSNIDFRRVTNLNIYFQKNTIKLTTDIKEIQKWQPGDIVVFGNEHIGIISDKRNKKGIPYLIHNAGQPKLEEDALERWNRKKGITGHYRFHLKLSNHN